jgi:uncharacterized OB-fold protein
MTIMEAIHAIDSLKPNSYSESDKIRWLSTLDGLIKIEIIDTKCPVHVKYEPENTCPECGRELTDFGYCPYCDFLDEDIE